jgi:8-oxo-dGTP pyrophosphatase MutT (NUDIX family)
MSRRKGWTVDVVYGHGDGVNEAIAQDGVEWRVRSGGQDWQVGWFAPPEPPPGRWHGSTGLCLAAGEVVQVSEDDRRWGLPGGRPEDGEDWYATLCREVAEEACAQVVDARLLGFSRGICLRGHEAGLVLVRSQWLAHVTLDDWQPRHEMTGRRLVSFHDALSSMWIEDGFAPMYRRMFAEAARVQLP